MILTLGEKFEVVAHQLLQHAGQAKENPEIMKAVKQKPFRFLFIQLQIDKENQR